MSSSPHGKVLCADCGKAYRWQAELAGKKVRCTRCEGVMLFPTDAPGLDKMAKATMRSHGKATDKPRQPTDATAKPATSSTSSDSTDMTGTPGISGAQGGPGGLMESDGSSSSSLPIDEELGIDLDLDLGAAAPGGGGGTGGDMIDIRAAEETPPSAPAPGAVAHSAPQSVGESAEKVCPSCKAALSPNAVLCVKCGFNLKKGKATASNLDGNSGGGLLSRLTRGWRKGGA